MKRYILFFLFVIQVLFLKANENDNNLTEANKAYSEGEFDTAIILYESILDNGFDAPELYYNLGNAYFKTNDIPAAILNYEKAKKTDPNNEDIEFNLKVANSKIVDKIEAVPELFIWRWWRSVYNLFSVDVWGIISVVCFFVVFLLFVIYLISRNLSLRKFAFWFGTLMLSITFFTISCAYLHYNIVKSEKEAIVFTPTITVKSSPDKNSVDLFVVHEGTKVKIIDFIGEWYEIKIANGSEGWFEASHIRKI